MAFNPRLSTQRTIEAIDKKIQVKKDKLETELAPLYQQREILAAALEQMKEKEPELPEPAPTAPAAAEESPPEADTVAPNEESPL